MALAGGRAVSVDSLIDAVWDEPTDTARNAVQVAVTGLRRSLGAQSIVGGRDGYRLQTSLLRIDLDEARELAAGAQDALEGGRPAAALAACVAASALFVGEPLSGLQSMRSAGQRERAEELHGSISTMRARALVELQRFPQAIELLREGIARRPYDEALHELLMRALALDERPSEALEAYEGLRRRLADELGTDPAPSTTHTFTDILAGRLAPADSSVRRREPRLTVPSPGSRLLGRDAEKREIISRFERGDRLLSVIGTGGVGKTRLALEVAAEVPTATGLSSIFVDLAAAREAGDVRSVVSGALDVGGDSMAASLTGSDTLLVLDNAEHVLDEVVQLVIELLAVPTVRLLVTSRTPLHLRDESIVDLDGLESDGADSPAVQLLAQRSHLTDEEAAAVSDQLQVLAMRTDGIPLMLELLASALQWRTPGEVADELDIILRTAADTSRDRPARHASLNAVVEWSVLRASSDARIALGALGVIRGEFSDSAAAAVIAAAVPGRQWRELLAELLDLSLVKRLRAPGQVRFRLLEPVRLYLAGSRLTALPTVAVHRAHAMHYLGTLLDLDRREQDDHDALERYVRLEDANLNAAAWWLLDNDPEIALEHLGPIAYSWYERARHTEVAKLDAATRGLGVGTAAQRAAVAMCALASLADVAQGSDPDAETRLESIAEIADQLDDTWHRRFISLAVLMARLDGDLDKALAMTDQLRLNHWRSRQTGYNIRASILASMGDFVGAMEAMESAVENLDGLDRTSKVFALSNFGYGLLVEGDLDRSRAILEQGLVLAAEGDLALELAALEMNLGWLELRASRPDEALAWVRRTLVGKRGQADWTAFTEALLISASAFLALHDLDATQRIAQTAVPRAFAQPEVLDTFIMEHASALADSTGIPVDGKPPHDLEEEDLLRLIDAR